jgi:hypothetical protein
MPRRSTHRLRRSSAEWGIRIALALTAALLGSVALTHALAQVLRTKAPDRAHALAPYDGRITASLAAKISGPYVDPTQRARAERLARQALDQDPTAVAAAATLGLNAQLRGDVEMARRQFSYSNRLSRRDLMTRLWMIEDAVTREDIAGAVRNYDIALRTSRSAPAVLHPVLASAISDAAIRAEVVKTVAGKAPWGRWFIDYAGSDGADPIASARLFQDLGRLKVPVPDSAQASLIRSLVKNKNYDVAWQYYASVRPQADRRMSRDPQFVAKLEKASLLDWVPLGNDSGLTTTIQATRKDGAFYFSAPASVGGALLEQLQLLPAGRYLLQGRSTDIDQVDAERPYWTLTCDDGRELGRVVVPSSVQNKGLFRGYYLVPSNCPAQYLRLIARPSRAVDGLSGQIDQVALRKVGQVTTAGSFSR